MKEDNKVPFSEKHPRLNLLLGLLMVIGSLYIAIKFVIFIVKKLIELTIWGMTMVSTLDAVIIVALITGAVSILGVVFSSIIAKALDHRRTRREYLTQKREKPYCDFISIIYKMQQKRNDGEEYSKAEMVSDMLSFSKELTLWGSPKVVNGWIKFRENALKDNSGIENLLQVEKIMNDMRKDLGLPKVKEGNLLGLFVNDIKQAIKDSKK